MRLWPKSLFGQILLTILLGLFLIQLFSMAHLWNERSDLAAKMTGYHAAERIGGIIELLDAHTESDRERFIKTLSVPPLRIVLNAPWEISIDQDPAETDYFLRQLNRVLDKPYPIQAVTISQEAPWTRRAPPTPEMVQEAERMMRDRGPHRGGGHGRGMHDLNLEKNEPNFLRPDKKARLILMARVQVRLSDGQVVTFLHDLRREPVDWPLQAFILLLIMGISISALAAWTVRYLTRPLRVLSNAAIGLGKDLDQSPLPETGPTEVASAAQAFNTMQKAIKQHVESRSQTLAALSHDLRLPITRIRLRIEKLQDQALKNKLEDDLADIDVMIDDTLAFLRAGNNNSEEFVPIHLNALIESIVDDIEAMGASVTVNGKAQQPIIGQPQALRRCLSNLIDNARRYGDGQIELVIVDSRRCVEIEIRDRGPGISDEDKDRVFEPYVRLETSRAKHTGGSGLGLATAKATIKGHEGDIHLKDHPSGGLIVVVSLPR